MDVLTPLQASLLREIGRSPLKELFYLTGGTALSAFYLGHRYSVDLDFFTPDPTAVERVPPLLQEIAHALDAEITFTRMLDSFLEGFLQSASGERVEMDFAQDSPFRLEPTRIDDEFGVQVDGVIDIAANKLSALFGRAEPKDFVDVYFICRDVVAREKLLELTRQKHLGIDDYWLAVAFKRAEGVALLPRMIKPLSLPELKGYFLEWARGGEWQE
jgi:predicted nucleotidyltransferase component of viral defense system